MRAVKRWRYFCDHCNKSKGTKSSMALHESHCTKNPARSCRMCEASDPAILLEATVLVKGRVSLEEVIWPGGSYDRTCVEDAEGLVKELRSMLDDCPACILSAIRIGGISSNDLEGHFDFSEEGTRYIKQKRDDERDSYYYE